MNESKRTKSLLSEPSTSQEKWLMHKYLTFLFFIGLGALIIALDKISNLSGVSFYNYIGPVLFALIGVYLLIKSVQLLKKYNLFRYFYSKPDID